MPFFPHLDTCHCFRCDPRRGVPEIQQYIVWWARPFRNTYSIPTHNLPHWAGVPHWARVPHWERGATLGRSATLGKGCHTGQECHTGQGVPHWAGVQQWGGRVVPLRRESGEGGRSCTLKTVSPLVFSALGDGHDPTWACVYSNGLHGRSKVDRTPLFAFWSTGACRPCTCLYVQFSLFQVVTTGQSTTSRVRTLTYELGEGKLCGDTCVLVNFVSHQ